MPEDDDDYKYRDTDIADVFRMWTLAGLIVLLVLLAITFAFPTFTLWALRAFIGVVLAIGLFAALSTEV